MRDAEPALWALSQDYTGPDGRPRPRHGFFARVRVEEYGAGRIRPHERTHPGPKEDRLRLTRATQANLSPIFSALRRPRERGLGRARAAHAGRAVRRRHRSRRHAPPPLARRRPSGDRRRARRAWTGTELLIADGHHRYETARVYAEEVGGEGGHRYVLMYLVALQDPGLEIFPTHRLLVGLDGARRDALHGELERDWEIQRVDARRARAHRRRPGPRRLPGEGPRPHALAARPGDRRRRAARARRGLPPPRHRGARGARAPGRPGHDRGRHQPPQRARLRALDRGGPRARGQRARPTRRSSCARRPSSTSGRSPPPARRCRRSRRTSSPRS